MTSPAPTHPVAIGLGTNLGDRRANLRRAIERIAALVADVRCSTIWASDAMLLPGAPTQWSMPFLNAVVVGHTALGPHRLLTALQGIELDMGRGPHEKWAPRTIDLDILLYADAHLDDARLVVPHPGIMARPFVLLPLAELWPERHLPGDPLPLARRAAAYRADHPEHLPFHTRTAAEQAPVAAGA